MTRPRPAPRWEDPGLDEAALGVARLMRGAVGTLRSGGQERWASYLEPLVPVFEDGDTLDLLRAARRARAAYGARDSVLEAWPSPDAIRLRDGLDVLLVVLERRRAARA